MKRSVLALALVVIFTSGCARGGADRPELSIFSEHRSDYERVVEMARTGELGHSKECIMGSERYALPSALEALSAPCVTTGPYDWFSVSFTPLDDYYRIVYVDEPDMISFTPDCRKGDAAILATLDKNWFFCKGEWN